MGNKSVQLKLPVNYHEEDLFRLLKRQFRIGEFTFHIDKKSLDARKKNDIHWLINGWIVSEELKGDSLPVPETIDITPKKRKERVVVVGSGPAGFFAAHVLQKAGFSVTIVERGSQVGQRAEAIRELEKAGLFSTQNNYAFGEGGAGTFSDGKLTSRNKHISKERRFILSEYIEAGAPPEILYMAHPHVGTDNLKIVVANLRETFVQNGGVFLFDTLVEDFVMKGNRVDQLVTNKGNIEADLFIMATGHSAYDTYRMLINRGVPFRTKNFAIGHRIEHPQTLINKAQWGVEKLPGAKAAEYRLSAKSPTDMPVYSFCMCPGGTVVPAAAFSGKSVVNGMSYYQRNGFYANSGIVAGVHPDQLSGHTCTPLHALDWMDRLEERYFNFANGYEIPACTASDFLQSRVKNSVLKSSYPLGIQPAPLYSMLPVFVSKAIASGLEDFNRKIKGFDQGVLMGLESKTSSPVQVVRETDGRCAGFDNLYFIGEGSGYTGGIISSAADGVKCAMTLCAG
jgi:hypothetical protein